MGERDRIPNRNEIEHALRALHEDLAWLYDAEIKRSGPYRWAWSGMDKLRSSQTGLRRGSHPETIVDGESVAVTQVESAAFAFSGSRVRRAGYAIIDAQKLVARARQQLTLMDKRPADESTPLPGWVSTKERDRLIAKQRERQKKGIGYGDG